MDCDNYIYNMSILQWTRPKPYVQTMLYFQISNLILMW
jgi:hypothetical protein